MDAGSVSIEELEVGDRVAVSDPAACEHEATDDLLRVVLVTANADVASNTAYVELLVTPAEAGERGYAAGARVWYEHDGFGLAGWADVAEVSSTAVPPGEGCVVTVRVGRESNVLVRTHFSDAPDLVSTGGHPIWSQTRATWVSAADLAPGEVVATATGAAHVEWVADEPGVQVVWNLEVEGAHEYFAGDAAVRVHNAVCPTGSAGVARGRLRSARTVRFSQDSIDGAFSDGSRVSDLTGRLRADPSYAARVEPIRLVRFRDLPSAVRDRLAGQGVSSHSVFTLDNRRLFSARQARTRVNSRWATPSEISEFATTRRFSTRTGGRTPRVR